MAPRRIPIGSLKIGMFVIGVDRSWLQTPFLRHRFTIKDRSEIDTLAQAGITEVTIDPDHGLDVTDLHPVAVSQPVKSTRPDRSSSALPTTQSIQPPSPSSSTLFLAEKFSLARQRKVEWTARLKTLFESTRTSGLIQFDAVHKLVGEMVSDILDHEAACFAVLGAQKADRALHEHGLTVCTLSVILGHALNYPRQALEHLGLGALVHDVGLLRLPRNLVKRSKHFTPAQQTLYDSHPIQGVGVIENSGPVDPMVLDIVKGHHQVEPPSTPAQSSEQAAADPVRLVMIVDQFDELVTGQGGLPPLSSHQALTQLYQEHRQCPAMLELVSHLIRTIGVYPLYSVVELKSGELGVVTGITPGKAHLPVVHLFRDKANAPYVPPVEVDLAQETDPERTIQDIRDADQEGIDLETILKQVA